MAQSEQPLERTTSSSWLLWAVLGGVVVFLVAGLFFGNVGGSALSTGEVALLMPQAFLAGLLSFLSPCTLPLLPAYFAYRVQAQKEAALPLTVAFFFGLATTITLLGASATTLSRLLFQHLHQLTQIGGVVIFLFGVLSLLGLGIAGPQLQRNPAPTWIGSYLYGATFALGWSACIGPILGAILMLLATSGSTIVQGAMLAFIYALGLGAPLMLITAFFGRLGHGTRFWQFLRGRGWAVRVGPWTLHLHTTNILSGLLLMVMGYLLASGQLAALTQLASRSPLSQLVVEAEEWLIGLFGGR